MCDVAGGATSASEVHPDMPGNVPLCLETLATVITLELPQASVSEGVPIETRNCTKLFTVPIYLFT